MQYSGFFAFFWYALARTADQPRLSRGRPRSRSWNTSTGARTCP